MIKIDIETSFPSIHQIYVYEEEGKIINLSTMSKVKQKLYYMEVCLYYIVKPLNYFLISVILLVYDLLAKFYKFLKYETKRRKF